MKSHFPYRKQESQIKGKFRPRRPKSRKEEAEFGPGKEDILVCKKCKAFYWYKSWHHRLSDYPELKKEKRIKFVLCPACQMIEDGKYEGEVILKNAPQKFYPKIKKLAQNFGERAYREDPLDRIISIKEKKISRATAKRKRGRKSRKEIEGKKYIRILTTENQLAQKLAQKINEIFGRKLKVSITHSHREDPTRVEVDFEKYRDKE